MHEHESRIDWARLLDWFGLKLVRYIGWNPDYLPTDRNIIVDALKHPAWVAEARLRFGKDFNRTSVSKVATICQMVIFDNSGGPEQDGRPKALRRHWYQWFKVDFAQPFSLQLGEDPNDPRWGLNWAGRLSTIYAWFVDESHLDVTYKDLWVEDASRMMSRLDEPLYYQSNIVVAVEKDSLFSDFQEAAKSLGATCLISGKGKNSKAATEKMLRDIFGWTPDGRYNYDTDQYEEIFTEEDPLVVIHVSDHDYDGHAVIGPTFAEQARRYTPHVLEARVGIKPPQVVAKGYSLQDKMYQVKVSNSGYVDWATDHAIFVRECVGCGQKVLSYGANGHHSECCNEPYVDLTIGKKGDPAYGLEVEAMRVSDYLDLLVEGLYRVLPFPEIVRRLRIEMTADSWEAMSRIREHVEVENKDYAALVAELRRLENIKLEFESNLEGRIYPIAEERKGNYADQGRNPEREAYVDHVVSRGWGPWRPFDIPERTRLLVADIHEEESDIVGELVDQEVTFDQTTPKIATALAAAEQLETVQEVIDFLQAELLS